MMKNSICIVFFCCFLLSVESCNSKLSFEEFNTYIHEDKNGLNISRMSGGLNLSCTFLPSEFLALKEVIDLNGDEKKKKYFQILKEYQSSYSFLISIDSKEKDLLLGDVDSYDELRMKADKVNFENTDAFSLLIDGKEVKPVLCNFENTYGLNSVKKFIVVFDKRSIKLEPNLEAIDLVFYDNIFNSGVSHFAFLKKNILCIPDIQL